MQTHLHYVEYPDIDIQINYPNNMVNADAPLEVLMYLGKSLETYRVLVDL